MNTIAHNNAKDDRTTTILGVQYSPQSTGKNKPGENMQKAKIKGDHNADPFNEYLPLPFKNLPNKNLATNTSAKLKKKIEPESIALNTR